MLVPPDEMEIGVMGPALPPQSAASPVARHFVVASW